jgi:aspartate 1-decarboxylase
MPSPDSYDFVYVVNAFAGDGSTSIGGANAQTVTLTDSVDTLDNDSTAVGSSLESDFFGTVQLIGLTSSGDPVIFNGSSAYVLSDNGALGPGFVTTTTSGAYAYCFGEGTLITTPGGGQAVEELAIGDLVMTAQGTFCRVKWIGRQTVSTRFGPAERLMPVRFAAGSLGDGLPHADLTVTADHGMLVDGVICHAGALVNGATIRMVPLEEMGETYTVYHVETENHEIILANGAPAETFIDNVSRRSFDNYAEFETLYGDVPEMEELPYPRAMSARQVPGRIVAKLAGKAVA